jgi:hypothetical protein
MSNLEIFWAITAGLTAASFITRITLLVIRNIIENYFNKRTLQRENIKQAELEKIVQTKKAEQHQKDKIVGKLSSRMLEIMNDNNHEFNALQSNYVRKRYLLNQIPTPNRLIMKEIQNAYNSAFNLYILRQVKSHTGKGTETLIPTKTSINHVLKKLTVTTH